MYQNFERQKLTMDSAVCYKWHETETNACILFVHGLGGDAETTWGNLPNLIMGTAYSRHTDLIAYSYKTSALGINSPRIDSLTKDFSTFCETVVEKCERVYVISHSLGSVITLNAIPKLSDTNPSWINKIRGHILLAPALWGSKFGGISTSPTSRELKRDSTVLTAIRETWKNSAIQNKIESFVLFGSGDKIIKDNVSELKNLGITLKSVARGHVDISKIDSINEITYQTIMNCLYIFDDSNHYDSRSYILRSVYDSRKIDWEYDDHRSEFTYIPNFKIKIVAFTQRSNASSFVEPWTQKFPDPNGMRHYYAIFYLNFRIHDFSMIFCDGHRYLIPMPKSASNLVITKKQYALGKIMEVAGMYDDLDTGLQQADISVE